jgi:hypothetical protein
MAGPAMAASLSDIQNEISTQLPTTGTQQITAAKLRGVLSDIAAFIVAPTAGLRYAAIPDLACGSDMSAVLQSELNAVGVGGTLVLPAGCIRYGGATVTSPASVHIKGQGDPAVGGSGGTQLNSTRTSGVGLILVGTGASLEHLWFYNAQGSTTQVAIQQGDGENPQKQFLRDIHIEGFGIGIDVHDGFNWTHDNVQTYAAKQYNVRARNVVNGDQGDWSIVNSNIAGCVTCLQYESGGGGKIANTKIIGGTTGINANFTASTSDFQVASTVSIENFTGPAVYIGATGIGFLGNVTLEPQIATNGNCIEINQGAGRVSVPMSANLFCGGYAVQVTGGSEMNLAPTVGFANSGAFFVTGGTKINKDTSHILNVQNGILLIDQRSTDPGNETNNLKFSFSPTNISGTYRSMFTLRNGAFNAITVDQDIHALINGVGVAGQSRSDIYTRGSGTSSQTNIRNTSAGAAFDTQYVMSNADGTIDIQGRLNAAGGGSSFRGDVTVKVTGGPTYFAFTQ